MAFSIRPENHVVDTTKFNSCKHRSDKEETIESRSCCQTSTRKGFICYKVPINGVSPLQCVRCDLYENKG